jgi:PTS system nitrogen regulatory IIA component
MRAMRKNLDTPEHRFTEHIMDVEKLLPPDRVACNVDARSRKHLFEILSEMLGNSESTELPASEIFSGLAQREQLGSTGLQNGIAIPHGRAAGLLHPSAAFAKLVEPVDYGAPDNKPVDLALAVLLPEGEQNIEILALTAEVLSDPELQSQLRACSNSRSLHELLIATARKWTNSQT